MYVNIVNNVIVGSFHSLPKSYANISGFDTLPPDVLAEHGFYEVVETEKPSYNEVTESLVESITLLEGVPTKTFSIAAKPTDNVLDIYTKALETHFDSVAKQRKYDNRLTCALRAGYAGPFQTEGTAFASWMDTCNAYGYTEMQKVLDGLRPMPSIEELLAELPVAPW